MSWGIPRITVVVAAACCWLPLQLRAEVIRLLDGRLLQGKVIQHNGLEVTIERIDNGGQVTIPFREMLPVDRKRIEERLGYRSVEDLGQRIAATRLVIKDSADRPIGLMNEERSNDQTVVIERRGVAYSYQRSFIEKLEAVQVAETDVLTPQQIYDRRQAEISAKPTQDARDHFELAKYCESLGLFEEAQVHYQQAVVLDAVNYELQSRAAIDRLSQLIADRDALKAYRAVYSAMSTDEYARARELLAALQTAYPNTTFPQTFEQLATEITTREAEYHNKMMQRYLYLIARDVAERKAREAGITVDDAVAYGKGQMQADVLERLAAKLNVDATQIKAIFDARQMTTVQRISLGSATYVLEGAGQGGAAQGGSGGVEGQADQIRKLIEGMRGGRGGGGNNTPSGQPQVKKPEEARISWWRSNDVNARRQIIYAAWARKNCEIVQEEKTPCSHCKGLGKTTIYAAETSYQQTCPRCYGQKQDLALRFK